MRSLCKLRTATCLVTVIMGIVTHTATNAQVVCPAGSFLNTASRYDLNYMTCVTCPANTFNDQPGLQGAGCRACPAGTTSPAGSTSSSNCAVCPAGSYVHNASRYDLNYMTCVTCPANTFNDQAGLQGAGCPACPAGYVSPAGSSACVPCPAGSFINSQGQCVPCPMGAFSTAARTVGSCQPCPDGRTSRQGATSAADCVPCPPATFHTPFNTSTAATSNTNAGRCSVCPRNTFSNATGVTQCTPCPAGYTSPEGSRACSVCPAGGFVGKESGLMGDWHALVYGGNAPEVCQPCPRGTFSPTAGSFSCSVCPLGSTSAANSSVCTPCGDGEGGYIEYPPLSAAAPDSIGAGVCARCADPRMAAGALTCPPGQGRSSCAAWEPCGACPAGAFAVPSSDMLWDTCVACPVGSFTAAPGATRCEGCAPGSSTPNAGGTRCTPCEPGSFGVSAAVAAGSAPQVPVGLCPPCPHGTYAPAPGTVGACTACPRGRTHFTTGRRSEGDCVVAFDPAAGPIRVVESITWVKNTSQCRLTRTGPPRTLDVSAAGAAVDVAGAAGVVYDREEELLYGVCSPRPNATALEQPLRTGVASYRVFQLANGTIPGTSAAVRPYVMSVTYTDGVSVSCSGQAGQQQGSAPQLVLTCMRWWAGDSDEDYRIVEVITLAAAVA